MPDIFMRYLPLTQLNHKGTTAEKQEAANKADQIIYTLIAAPPDQIDVWVENNLNSLADAKLMFRRILKLLAVLAHRTL